MLLTTCPNCVAQFKVQPEQLNIRQGRVMCGRCRQVFNAFESLKRVEDDPLLASLDEGKTEDTTAKLDVVVEISKIVKVVEVETGVEEDLDDTSLQSDYLSNAEKRATSWAEQESASLYATSPSLLNVSATSSAIKPTAEPEHTLEPEIAPPSVAAYDPVVDAPVDTNTDNRVKKGFIGFSGFSGAHDAPLNAQTIATDITETSELPKADEPSQADLVPLTIQTPVRPLRDLRDQPGLAEQQYDDLSNNVALQDYVVTDEAITLGEDNPLLLNAEPDRAPRTKFWLFGCLLLLLALAAQASYFLRATIIEMAPQSRPLFVKVCDVLGCAISWGRDSKVIKITESDLIEPPGKPGRILVTATLVNKGEIKQELPSIELRLTDNANQVLVSRILQPSDYLGRAPLPDEAIAPNAELFINLNIESANKSIASGYGLRAFYP